MKNGGGSDLNALKGEGKKVGRYYVNTILFKHISMSCSCGFRNICQ